MPIAARGEVCRLIALYGGLDNFVEKGLLPESEDKTSFGTPSGLPVLKHGDLKMSQSLAIEMYLSMIAPKYANLTQPQRAIDAMYSAIKEDVLAGIATTLFGSKTDEEKKAAVTGVFDKYIALLEGMLPATGYVNGLDFATVADLNILVIFTSYMPFGGAAKMMGYDLTNLPPKLTALLAKLKGEPVIAQYFSDDKFITKSMFGL